LADDPDFQRLSPHAILVFYTIRVCKEHGAGGIFRYYIETIARRCHLSIPKVTDALQELARPKPNEEHGWIEYDDAILWVVNGLRYDPHVNLANEKHKMSVVKGLSELPKRKLVLSYCDYYKLPYPYTTHSLQDTDSESESDSESKESKEKESKSSPREIPKEGVPWSSRFCLIQKYNRESPDNVPTVTSISKTRLLREQAFLRQFPDEAWWTQTFLQYHRSRFLSGKSPPGNGHGSFKPDFDWLLSKGKDGVENCVKVHDGRYRDG
jgi:hypothetical protein